MKNYFIQKINFSFVPHAQNLKIKTSKCVFFQFFKIFEFFRFFPLFISKKMSKKVICWKTFDPEGRNRSNYAQNYCSFFRYYFLTMTESVKGDK